MIKGIGVDVVQITRVKEVISNHILTINEKDQFNNAVNKQEFLASRFAAKEAVIKATDKKYSWQEIEITNTPTGKPICNIDGIQISITHEKECAIAFCIWED